MKQQVTLLVFSLILLQYNPAQTNAQPTNLWATYCAPTSVVSGSETAYAANLASAFSDLITAAGQGQSKGIMGYETSTPVDFAQARYYCRGQGFEVTAADCQACVADAQQKLSGCTTSVEAIAWYEDCTVHFANRDMYGVLQTQPSYLVWSIETFPAVDHTDDMSESIRQLTFEVIKLAAQDSIHGYAYGSQRISSDAFYYFMAQCSADIVETGSVDLCNFCLQTNLRTLELNEGMALPDSQFLAGLMPSCQIFLGYLQFDASASASPGSPSPKPSLVQPISNSTALAPAPAA